MGAFFGSLLGKILSAVVGAALFALAIMWISHEHAEKVRLGKENTRLEANLALLQENAKLSLRLTMKQTDDRAAVEKELTKVIHDFDTRPLPKLPAVCSRALDLPRDAVAWLQRESGSPSTRTSPTPVQRPAAVLPRGHAKDGKSGTGKVHR